MQVELDAVVVLEHLEANGVLAAEGLLFRIDAHVEVVVEQIVVGAMPAILAAQEVRLRRGGRRLRMAHRTHGGKGNDTEAGGGPEACGSGGEQSLREIRM